MKTHVRRQPAVPERMVRPAPAAHGPQPVRQARFDFAAIRIVPRSSPASVPYRAEMERAFETSFSGVTAHLGEQRALAPFGARAAAWSDTIAFAGAQPDRATVAHELAHVEQLRHARGTAPSGAARPDHPAEREAAQIAAAVSAGAPGVRATAAPGGVVAFDRDPDRPLHGELLPVAVSQRIGQFSVLAREAIFDVDHGVNPYTLLRDAEQNTTPAELYRWALELQSVPHPAYSNYLRAWYHAIARYEPARALAIGQRIADMGVDFGPSAGSFTSFEHTDPREPLPASLAPEVARSPIGRGVDHYTEVKYDLAYRASGGRLSTILQLRYADGATLDLDFDLISDNAEPAQLQAIARSYVGPSGRVFPLRLDRATTPRLHVARQAALSKIAESNLDFENLVTIGLAGIFSNLPAGPVVVPEPEVGPLTGPTYDPDVAAGGKTGETTVRGPGVSNPEVAKLEPPPRPPGMTQSQFGKNLIGWGSGPGDAAARVNSVTAQDVARMQRQGLTRDLATQWRDFYRNEFTRNKNNLTAKHRAELMSKILTLFQ